MDTVLISCSVYIYVSQLYGLVLGCIKDLKELYCHGASFYSFIWLTLHFLRLCNLIVCLSNPSCLLVFIASIDEWICMSFFNIICAYGYLCFVIFLHNTCININCTLSFLNKNMCIQMICT